MSEPESPADKVRAALPGTLPELCKRTDYPVGTVLAQLQKLRARGVRIGLRSEGTYGAWLSIFEALDTTPDDSVESPA